MLKLTIGESELCLPTIDERGQVPHIILSDGTEIPVDRNVILQIRDWVIIQDAIEDVRYFIESMDEDNTISDEITAKLIEENMEEIIEYYLDRRYDGDNWYSNMYMAIESFVYDLKRRKEQ